MSNIIKRYLLTCGGITDMENCKYVVVGLSEADIKFIATIRKTAIHLRDLFVRDEGLRFFHKVCFWSRCSRWLPSETDLEGLMTKSQFDAFDRDERIEIRPTSALWRLLGEDEALEWEDTEIDTMDFTEDGVIWSCYPAHEDYRATSVELSYATILGDIL